MQKFVINKKSRSREVQDFLKVGMSKFQNWKVHYRNTVTWPLKVSVSWLMALVTSTW